MIHSNIRSLNHNFDTLSHLLKDLDFTFSVIALSETWNPISKDKTFISPKLKDYNDFENLSGSTSNSGCGFHVQNDLVYIRRNDLYRAFCSTDGEFQALWIEVINEHEPNILICVIYLHPKLRNPQVFMSYMETTLFSISKENKTVVVTVDTNLDLLKCETKEHINNYVHLLFSYFMIPHILQPTRFAGYSNPTLIDHIFCNYSNSNLLSGNLIPHITDHLPNFLIITELDVSLRTNANTYKINYSQFNKNKFLKSVEALKWDDLISSKPTTDEKYNSFHDKLLETIDMHAPYTKLSKRKI